MKILQVDKKFLSRWPEKHATRKGRCCRRQLRVGEWVVVDDVTPVGAILESISIMHVSCLRERLDGVPEDDTTTNDPKLAFTREKRAIMREMAA